MEFKCGNCGAVLAQVDVQEAFSADVHCGICGKATPFSTAAPEPAPVPEQQTDNPPASPAAGK